MTATITTRTKFRKVHCDVAAEELVCDPVVEFELAKFVTVLLVPNTLF